MKIRNIILSSVVLIAISSCKPTINYIGNRYAPTSHVDIYFDVNDIQKEYTVMGKMKNEGSGFEDDHPETVQQAILEKAKSVGADAILFVGFYDEKVLGEHSHTTSNRSAQDDYYITNTSLETKKIYTVTIIKYD